MSGRILLLQAPNFKWNERNVSNLRSMPPIGLLCLSSYLRQHGYELTIIDLLVENYSFEEFTSKLQQLQPDLVGLQSYAETIDAAYDLVPVIKTTLPGTCIVFGGPMASFIYEEVLTRSAVDVVVRFEGEQTLLDLVRHLENPQAHPLREIAGLAYRDGEHVVLSPPRQFMTDLDALPFPDRENIALDNYAIPFSIVTSRGCPFACNFCSSTNYWGKRLRVRSASSVFSEVSHLCDAYVAESFYMCDDHFVAAPKRVKEFCRLLTESRYNPYWACESRVDIITEELLDVMYAAGLRLLIYGVESGVPSILKSINKGIAPEQVERAVCLSTQRGIYTMCCFMLGHPHDTPVTMRQNLEFMQRLSGQYGCRTVVSCNTPFPGTFQHDHPEELGLRINSKRWSDFRFDKPNISARGFSLDELREIYEEAREEFVTSELQNRALGVGMSSAFS